VAASPTPVDSRGTPPAPGIHDDAFVTGADGLTGAEVATRVERGQVNDTGERTSRSVGEIVRANVFTRFNALLGGMLVVILVVGHVQDALFGIVLVTNALIGIVQEWRAKRTLEALAIAGEARPRVLRDGAASARRSRSNCCGDSGMDERRAGNQGTCTV
jgi:cation-transporting ATPase E